jgi:hypothetical protein
MPDRMREETAQWTPALRGAAGLVDKLLVDSSRNGGGSEPASPESDSDLRTLMGIRDAAADGFLVTDFSWRRGRVLREQSARAFDPAEMRPLLSAVRSVVLYGGSKMEARLYFQWLVSRLGRSVACHHEWEGPLREGFRLTFTVDGAPAVDIGCTRGGCLSRGEERGAYRFPSDGEILLEEVDTLSRDSVFSDVLSHGRGSSG